MSMFSSPPLPFDPLSALEVGDRHELAVARVDVLALERPKAVQSEILDRERRNDGAVDDRAAQRLARDLAVGREAAEQTARETVAGTGRVDDVLERKCGHRED